MKLKQGGQGFTLAALAAALGVAVYLNWSFAQQAPQAAVQLEQGGAEQVSAQAEEETAAVFDPLQTQAEPAAAGGEEKTQSANKNYGEAQLVSVNQDSGKAFFETARLSRSKTRDEALDSIQKAMKGAGLSDEEKEELTQNLSNEVSSITAESSLETLIKAKGFADCVVFLDGEKAEVTVMTENDALTAAEVTQIRDVLLNKCKGLKAESITVIEVK